MRKIIILSAATLVLSSCGIYNKYKPVSEVPEGLYGSESVVADTANFGNLSWREVFTDPSLQNLIDSALVRNTDMQTAHLRVKEAEATLLTSKLSYLPSLFLAPEGAASSFDRGKATQTYSLPVTASWELDIFGKVTTAKRRAKAAYEQSQASMVKVNRNLEYATITSPIDGVVINRAVEEGQTVAAGFETPTLFTIAADLTKMQVIADVDEADIGNVENGQRVSFTVDAYPNDVFEGTVWQIRLGDSSSSSSSSTSTSTVVTYEVVITADNPDLKLKPRLTANVTIYTLERENVLTVPTKSLRFVPEEELLPGTGYTAENSAQEAPAGKRIIWVKQGQQLTPRAITVGSTSGNMIEVTEGLTEGEEIAVDLTSDAPAPMAEAAEKSPFMPGPPGGNKKK